MDDLHLLSILLLAVSSILDNLGTGVSYGLRKICIPAIMIKGIAEKASGLLLVFIGFYELAATF